MPELPVHIAQLLERQQRDSLGRAADSAGETWEGRDLSGSGNPLHTFDGDDGLITAELAKVRQQLLRGEVNEAGFVNALSQQRLFVPVIASGTGDAVEGDKQADISLVRLTAADGRSAMPVFTSVEALTTWHDQARPVAAETERVMLAALAEGAELVVLDPGADLTFVVRRPGVEALAQGRTWLPSYEDPALVEECAEVPELCPGVSRLILQPAEGIVTSTRGGQQILGGGSGPELRVTVVVEEGTDEVGRRLAAAAVRAALEEIVDLRRRADSLQIIAVEET